jgi:hypothetical protein
MNDLTFFGLSLVMAFTGILIPGLVAHEIISPAFMTLTFIAVAAVLAMAVMTRKNMPKGIGRS